jgi:maltose alpha-D-glucosyltransferase/alpha-amylase
LALQKDNLWYKDAVIYQLHVRTFCDSNADGVGDFAGLTQRLDYLQDLGITAIWLLPFFPSPLRDDGYDISDYTAVHSSYGSLEDFKAFLLAAHNRGMRIIIEMVLNHTSDQHPWFKEARSSRENPKRAHYFCGHGNIQLGMGPRFKVLLLASIFQPSAGFEFRQSSGSGSAVGNYAVLAGSGRRWVSI